MTQDKHTPGPWQHMLHGNCSDELAPWRVYTINNGEINSLPETRANAQLIAAAPEMLEALEVILHHENERIQVEVAKQKNGMPLVNVTLSRIARSAIKKARGQS